MGSWGFEPWEDDLAADWFAELFKKGKIAELVEKALRRSNVEEYWPEIRAAAHVVAVLGDVWPPDLLRPHHELAIARLEDVKHTNEFEGDESRAAEIEAQIAVLRGRLGVVSAAQPAEAKIPAKFDPARALADLKHTDPKVRKAGALWLGKYAFAGAHRWTEDWLKDPTTTRALIPLLDDPDPEVAEQAVTAIRGIMFRYHRDARALPGAVRLMRSERPASRMQAGLVAMQLGGEGCLDEILGLFADPDKSVRANVIGESVMMGASCSPEGRARLREAGLAALSDRAADVRLAAARLVAAVGGRDDLPALKRAKAATKGPGYQQDFREIIKGVEATK